jgi:hypothetical protein
MRPQLAGLLSSILAYMRSSGYVHNLNYAANWPRVRDILANLAIRDAEAALNVCTADVSTQSIGDDFAAVVLAVSPV